MKPRLARIQFRFSDKSTETDALPPGARAICFAGGVGADGLKIDTLTLALRGLPGRAQRLHGGYSRFLSHGTGADRFRSTPRLRQSIAGAVRMFVRDPVTGCREGGPRYVASGGAASVEPWAEPRLSRGGFWRLQFDLLLRSSRARNTAAHTSTREHRAIRRLRGTVLLRVQDRGLSLLVLLKQCRSLPLNALSLRLQIAQNPVLCGRAKRRQRRPSPTCTVQRRSRSRGARAGRDCAARAAGLPSAGADRVCRKGPAAPRAPTRASGRVILRFGGLGLCLQRFDAIRLGAGDQR